MLTFEQISPYLQKNGLINPKSPVLGELTIRDVSRRNHNFQVTRTDGTSYLLKQGLGLNRKAAIDHESRVYQFLGAQRPESGIQAYIPQFFQYDPANQLLILELVRDAQTLRHYHIRKSHFSPRLAAMLGKALATLHHQYALERASPAARNQFGSYIPWILSVHLPGLNLFNDFSYANIQLIKIIQSYPDFCDQLDALRSIWRRETFIHNDVKWDNCLVYANAASKRITQVKIIDWELANYGDPAWDVGCVFAEYLSFWLLSLPITDEQRPEQFMDLTQFPLEKMQPAILSFWTSYLKCSRVEGASADRMLKKAVQFGAARLIQAAMELMQMAAQFTGNTLAMLQVCYNILTKPEQAALHLLGIASNQ